MDSSQGFFSGPFSPLGSLYCDYFFYLTVIQFLIFVFIVIFFLYKLMFQKKNEDMGTLGVALLSSFVAYFTNRLLYSMCIGSTSKHDM